MSKTNLTLDLRNIDSNAFALIGQAQRTLRHNGMSDLIEEFRTEATSGDYSHLLCTLADWFDLELAGDEDEDDEDERYTRALYGDEDDEYEEEEYN